MRRLAGLVLLGALAVAAACAPKIVPVPVVSTPRFPDFIQPTVPDELGTQDARVFHERAWAFLQAGDFKNAQHELESVFETSPDFFPSEATAGYLALAQRDEKAALPHFDRALARQPNYVPALVGRGQALLALEREAEAITAFEAALVRDPALTDVQRRLEVLKFRGVERDIAAARLAARSGKTEDAIAAYRTAIANSPESAFLYRELAALERQHGETDAALEHLRKAIELDPSDAGSLTQVGDILDSEGDLAGAMTAYQEALAIEPDERVIAKRDALRAKAELARLPEEYRAIESSQQLTRADLAALIGVRLGPLLDTRTRDTGVITDARGHWAQPWILAVVRAGVLEAFANHTFQPQAVVRRVDFAQAISRLLVRVGAVAPARAAAWRDARMTFPDISSGHLAYPAASVAVASGVMTAGSDGSFQPSRIVTGQEAIAAFERLQGLANLSPRQTIGRP